MKVHPPGKYGQSQDPKPGSPNQNNVYVNQVIYQKKVVISTHQVSYTIIKIESITTNNRLWELIIDFKTMCKCHILLKLLPVVMRLENRAAWNLVAKFCASFKRTETQTSISDVSRLLTKPSMPDQVILDFDLLQSCFITNPAACFVLTRYLLRARDTRLNLTITLHPYSSPLPWTLNLTFGPITLDFWPHTLDHWPLLLTLYPYPWHAF